jgi:hypothetical protein
MTYKIYYIDDSGKMDYKLIIAFSMPLALDEACKEFNIPIDKISAIILVD